MKERKHISLADVKRDNPFTVPENYFGQFAAGIDGQIAVRRTPIFSLPKRWLYVAASVACLLAISRAGYITYQNDKAMNTENYELYVMSQVDETEVIDYYLSEQDSKSK